MAAVSTGMVLVFALIALALVLFVTEPVPTDITAIGVLVSLVVFQPFTGVEAREAIAGFASPATVTIIAMYILSEGIQQTGLVSRLGVHLARLTRGSESRLLGATVGTTGIAAGIVNNTPVVAVFIPMITGLAEESNISPSKLLLPLSYAAMLGGTLTLIGTSTNILASDLSRQLLDHPLSMFEFTPLGIVVLLVGSAYLLTVGRWLTPERIKVEEDLTAEFDIGTHLARVVVPEDSPLVDRSVGDVTDEIVVDLDVLTVERNGETYIGAETDQTIRADDVLTVRGGDDTVESFADEHGLDVRPRDTVTEAELTAESHPGTLLETVVPADSELVGQRVDDAQLLERFGTTILAIKRGDSVFKEGFAEQTFEAGDTLLLQLTEGSLDYLLERGDLVVTEDGDAATAMLEEDVEVEDVAPLSPKTPIAVGIMAGVIGLAALDVLPIVIAALGGVVAMIATGCLRPAKAYDAVSWNIIFLLAGVLPLGVAMQRTGGAEFIAGLLVQSAEVLPALAVLCLFYLLTGLLANIITPVASVVLMIPIAVDTATRIGANGFAFLLAVMFASSNAFMTPIGYQTNLMVYGPGGYKFTDYVRVGGPLQLLLAVVVTLGIAGIWGV